MLGRSVLVWLVIMVLAIVNGGFRQVVLVPALGERAGHVLSTILLSIVVMVAAWISLPWLRPLTPMDAWRIGLLWVGLTLAFEFLVGHFLFRTSWEQLVADYNVARGRVWVLVPITTLLAPVVGYLLRRPSP